MKRISILVLLLNMTMFINAQQAVLPLGAEATGSGGTVSFSIGQVYYNTYITGSGTQEEGIQIPIFKLIYTGGLWSPIGPSVSTGSSEAFILDGYYTLSSDASIKDLEIAPGGAIKIDSGANLTTNTLTLGSTSTSYSSLILDGTITGTVYYNRSVNAYTNDDTNNDNDLVSPPLTGQAFGSFATANTNLLASGTLRAFAPFNKATGTYTNYDTSANSSTSITAGTGYRAATTNGGTLTFTGTVETGDVAVNIINSGPYYTTWNLVGNPYPSYVDMSAFLNHEVDSGITNLNLLENASGIYGYDGDASDGWDIITLANVGSRLLAPGQGFFVAADANDVASYNLAFTPAMRTTGTSDDFILGREANPLTFLKLHASTTNNSYKTEFYFNDNASTGLDAGYDAVIWGGNVPNFALYSHLVEENTGVPIALQALGSTDISDITIPLGVKSNAGTQLTIRISDSNLPTSLDVYLEDVIANTTTLLTTRDYIITPDSNLDGTGRFFLRLTNNTLSTPTSSQDYIQIYTTRSPKEVLIKGQLQGAATAYLYDMQGRLVRQQNLNASRTTNTIDVASISDGVYVVKLVNNQQIKTQKVLIK